MSILSAPATSAYVHLHLLDGGSFTATWDRLHQGETARPFRMYDWAFFIQKQDKSRNVIWDLGLSTDRGDYPRAVQNFWDALKPVGPAQSIAGQITERTGVPARDIDTVVFSHAHYDHCRRISQDFPNAEAVFGPGTMAYCRPGHFRDETSQWEGGFFDPESATEKCRELGQGPWVPFGPFPRATDFFGDGSFWIFEAPGHMPGNIGCAVRLENGDWVILAGDCCHSRQLYLGERDFATFKLPDGSESCLQQDAIQAKDTILKLREVENAWGAHVALAHDTQWILDGKDEALMSTLSPGFREYSIPKIRREEIL